MPAKSILTIPQPAHYRVSGPCFFVKLNELRILSPISELLADQSHETGSKLLAFDTREELESKIAELNLTPLPEGQTAVPTTIPARDFIDRFTAAEYAAARSSTDANIQKLLAMIDTGEPINLKDPRTIGGVNYCASVSLIAADRVAEILA